MDSFNEKKWFVYLTDHHEGPFSLAEIQAKMAQSQVTTTNYVWAEGMADWKAMPEVPEFAPLVSQSPATATSAETDIREPTVTLSSPSIQRPAVTQKPLNHQEAEATPDSSTDLQESMTEPAQVIVPKKPKRKSSGSGWLLWLLILLIPIGLTTAYFQGALQPVLDIPAVKATLQTATDTTQPYLLKLVDHFPALGKWISPIPALEDVSPEEYDALKAAANQKLEAGPPKLAIALSTTDPLAPSFYIAADLPDGAVVDIYVEGIPDTLLNQLSFESKTRATLTKKLGKSSVIKFPDGKPLPKGEFIVYATEATEQLATVKKVLDPIPPILAKAPAAMPRGFKLLSSKTYFLGGPKDAMYTSRLKDFHDKLREKAQSELNEVKQFATTLEGRLTETTTLFAKVKSQAKKGKLPPLAKKSWSDFHGKWHELSSQLNDTFSKWTPEAVNDFFYGVLYQLTQSAGTAIEQVHTIQDEFVSGKSSPQAFDIQLGTVVSGAQTALAALKAKIEQAEKIAPTPNGMPRREGLQ